MKAQIGIPARILIILAGICLILARISYKDYTVLTTAEEFGGIRYKKNSQQVFGLLATITIWPVGLWLVLHLFHRVAGEITSQLLENLAVYLAQHDRGVHLAVAQLRQLLQGPAAVVVIF